MIIENLSTLKIHKMKSNEQYEREYSNGNIDQTAIYLTPDEDYVTRDEYEALLARVVALEKGGNGSTLTVTINKVSDSSGLGFDLYINNSVIKSISPYTGSDGGTFTYENVTSAYIKLTQEGSGYVKINGNDCWNGSSTAGSIENLPTSGTVTITANWMN